MRYLVRVDELKEKNDFLEQKLKIIHENVKNIEQIRESIIWEGKAKTKFFEKYRNYTDELYKMEDSLIEMIAFFKSYYSNFDEEYNNLKNKYRRILSEEVKWN